MIKIFNKHNIFIFLMSVSTLLLAGSAAYYSVFGLSSLFAGARFEVIILAGALEFSKLIVASYLHNNWSRAGWMKYYLSLAVLVLMVITSVGIYGFLTSAYQKTSDDVTMMNKRVSVVELKKERFNTQLTMLVTEKNQLSNTITDLSKGLSNNVIQYKDRETGQIITTTSSSTRRALKQELEESKQQRNKISQKIESLTDSVTNLDFKILEIQSSSDAVSEIGTLRYLSKITGKPMDIVVNWFTLLIVFVFDPLAIAMVIALNKLTVTPIRRKLPPITSEIEDVVIKEEVIIEDKPQQAKTQPKPKVNPKIKNEKVAFRKRYSDSDNINEGKF